MIPWAPNPVPDSPLKNVAGAVGQLIDSKITASQQVEYATLGPTCEGLPGLNFLNNQNCNPAQGPLVLASRMNGVPRLISVLRGSGTTVLPPEVRLSPQGPGPALPAGRVFVDAIGQMFEGRHGSYFPALGRALASTNGAYIGIAPTTKCLAQIAVGTPLASGSGTWFLTGDTAGTWSPTLTPAHPTGFFVGTWTVSGDHFVLDGTLAGIPVSAFAYRGLMMPPESLCTATASPDEGGIMWDDRINGTYRCCVLLSDPGLGGAGYDQAYLVGTDPYCFSDWVYEPYGWFGPNLCGGPTPMAFWGTLQLYQGSCGEEGTGLRVSTDLMASIEGNVPDKRWGMCSLANQAATVFPVLTLTIRQSFGYRRVASWPLTEVATWILTAGPASRFAAERAAVVHAGALSETGAPWLAGIRAFPSPDGTWCVTVKDSGRCWIYEVDRSAPTVPSDYSFPSLWANPEPRPQTWADRYSLNAVSAMTVGTIVDATLPSASGTSSVSIWASSGGTSVCTVLLYGSTDGGTSWTLLDTIVNPNSTGVTYSASVSMLFRADVSAYTSGIISALVHLVPVTANPWDAPTCVRLLETIDCGVPIPGSSALAAPVGFLRPVYL